MGGIGAETGALGTALGGSLGSAGGATGADGGCPPKSEGGLIEGVPKGELDA